VRSTLLPDVPTNYLSNTSSNRTTGGRGSNSQHQSNKSHAKKVSCREDEEDEESVEEDEEDYDMEDDEDEDDKPRRSSSASSKRTTARKRKNYREDSEDEFFEEEDAQPRRSSRSSTKVNYAELSGGEEEETKESTTSARKEKRKALSEDDVEVEFDDDDGIRPLPKRATYSPELKKPKVVKKSFEQLRNDYVAALPGAVRKFSVDIIDFSSKNPALPPGVIDANMRFLSILRRFKQDERTWIFWDPVDRSVPGYHDIIKSPMDLGTITYHVMHNGYNGDIALFAKVLLASTHFVNELCEQIFLLGHDFGVVQLQSFQSSRKCFVSIRVRVSVIIVF
jgi:hypothetical protein